MQAGVYREELNRPLTVSATAHGILLAFLLIAIPHQHTGESWGGTGGGAIEVSVVRNLPGVPLPRPAVVTQSQVATQAPGLYPTQPEKKAAPPEPPQQATELPTFGKEPQKKSQTSAPTAKKQQPAPPLPVGAIPSEGGGPPALPYTSFQVGGSEGGMSFGSGGGFGNRYPWYVESVRRRISSNWLQSSIDPYVKWAPRIEVTFEILRDGTVVNIQLMKSSNIASVDRSATRAIQASSPLERLPSDYRGDKVQVEFWFDFRRQ